MLYYLPNPLNPAQVIAIEHRSTGYRPQRADKNLDQSWCDGMNAANGVTREEATLAFYCSFTKDNPAWARLDHLVPMRHEPGYINPQSPTWREKPGRSAGFFFTWEMSLVNSLVTLGDPLGDPIPRRSWPPWAALEPLETYRVPRALGADPWAWAWVRDPWAWHSLGDPRHAWAIPGPRSLDPEPRTNARSADDPGAIRDPWAAIRAPGPLAQSRLFVS